MNNLTSIFCFNFAALCPQLFHQDVSDGFFFKPTHSGSRTVNHFSSFLHVCGVVGIKWIYFPASDWLILSVYSLDTAAHTLCKLCGGWTKIFEFVLVYIIPDFTLFWLYKNKTTRLLKGINKLHHYTIKGRISRICGLLTHGHWILNKVRQKGG